MALQRCRGEEGGVGWRWGDDGTCFVGVKAIERAMADGAASDPEGFAEAVNSGTDYVGEEVVRASREVKWDIPDGDEVIYLD